MPDTLHWSDERLEVHKVVVGTFDNNVFVLKDRATGAAVLLDAADEAERLLAMMDDLGVTEVWTTHGHWDHIQAVPQVREAGYRVLVGPDDADMLPASDGLIRDGDVLEVGELRVRAMHTPGHTPGSTCFAVEGSPVLFAGDTLFPGGPGNTDKDPARFAAIIESIRSTLFALPDETHVLPGHGADTTIGAERPSLPTWVERGW